MRAVLQRLFAPVLGLMVLVVAAPLAAQPQQTASPAAGDTAVAQNAANPPAPPDTPDLPVSLDRIREALAQAPPAEPLKGLGDQPTFRLQVQERMKFDQLMDTIRFDGGRGPEVAGGRANYDMQRLLFPPVDNPLVQPYAAFNTGEILTLGAEAILEKVVIDKVSHIFGDFLRAQSEREAREEVARALAAFQAAHPDTASPKN